VKIKMFYLLVILILTIVCWQVTIFVFGYRGIGWQIISVVVCLLCTFALVSAARRASERIWIYTGLFILAGLFLPASLIVDIFPGRWSLPFGSYMSFTLLLIVCTALVIAALLFYSALNLYKEWRNASAVAQRKQAGKTVVLVLVLSALLLARALYNLYWFIVWDSTSDPLGYLWLYILIPAALFANIVLIIILPGRTKLAGGLYLLLIPALVAVSARAQGVNFRQLTEERAERASQAIETYYARKGRYPQNLRQLTPGYTLSLPGPVIIYGQDWCYDRGDDYYRLGYVYREHWSTPFLVGQIYKTNQAPDLDRICGKEIAALQKRYPQQFFDEW